MVAQHGIHPFLWYPILHSNTKPERDRPLIHHRRPLLSLNTLFPKDLRCKLLSRSAWLSSTASASQPPAVPRTSLQCPGPGISVLRTSSKRVPKEVPAGCPTKGSVPRSQLCSCPTGRQAGGDPVPGGTPGARALPARPCWGLAASQQPQHGLPVKSEPLLTDHLCLNNSNQARSILPTALHRYPTKPQYCGTVESTESIYKPPGEQA